MSASVNTSHPDRHPEVRSLPGAIRDFASTLLWEAGFSQTETDKNELIEILRALEDSREEGRVLYPEVVLTSRLEECLEQIYPKQIIICGKINERVGRIKQALKRCVPLAVDSWVVILEVTEQCLRYGVVSSTPAADASSLPERLFEVIAEGSNFPLVYLRRHGTRAVFVRTPQQQTVVSMTLSEELLESQTHIENFSNVVVENVDKASRIGSARFVRTILTKATQEGHGLLACVLQPSSINIARSAFPDGAYLEPPLSLHADVRGDESSGAEILEADSALRARMSLAKQMIESDLMTIFSTDGKLIGYNVHIPNSSGVPSTGGGARTRAFMALCNQQFVRAVLICSQDGQTRYLSHNG